MNLPQTSNFVSAGVVRSFRELVTLVAFDKDSPQIGEILLVSNQNRTPLMVNHLASGNIAVCLNILNDRTLQKNMAVERSGRSIEITVGSAVMGRVFDALGRPLDGLPLPAPETLK